MKNKINTYTSVTCFLLTAFMLLSSCRSNKDLTYLRDVKGKETLLPLSQSAPVYRIQAKDNLYVSVISSNLEMNKLYNPAQAGIPNAINNQYDGAAGQFINGYEVDAEGNVALPLMGKLNVQGKTIAEAEKSIQVIAQKYLKEVSVKVRLLNYRVTVTGEVKNPGVYYNYDYDFTVLDAISMANGTTDYAELDEVMVLRATPNGTQTYNINLNSKSALQSDAFYMQPNDVLIVQPAANKNLQLRVPLVSIILTSVSSVLLLLNYLK